MKNRLFMTLLASAGLLAAAAADNSSGNGVEIRHLSNDNTLVRVKSDAKYLLLPIQESNEDARIKVSVANRPETTFYARLAKSKVDYMVPFDLTPYNNEDLVFLIETEQSRSNVRDGSEDAVWKYITVADTFDTSNREYFRPAFHHTPLYGWMNDPNGMFYKDGVWHLYYQYNPYGSKWQNMTWGHSTSEDLIHWNNNHPVAIAPDALGSIFSGSAVVDHNNTAGFGENAIVVMYTSADRNQTQSLAYSTDNGETFTKYPGNPIVTTTSEARDPNMFWHEPTQKWILILAHALDKEMLIYSSPNLIDWTFESSFGKGEGAQGGVWECPDLFELKVPGTNETKWVLICNINPGGPFGGSAAQYFIGDFDGHTFTADMDQSGVVPTKWMDYGKDHYATVSWSNAPDNRRTVIGWMSNWQYAPEVPTRQFRSANTLPRDLSLFRDPDGELFLASAPSPEVDALRGKMTQNIKSLTLNSTGKKVALPADGLCEIAMDIDARNARSVRMELSNNDGDRVVMYYDPAKQTLSFDRRNSGEKSFSYDFPAVVKTPTFENNGHISLRIFVDKASVEVFEKNGRFVMTNLVFPEKPYTSLTISADGKGAKATDIQVYSIKK